MKCIECGTAMKTRKENYCYDECGLKHITLVGVDVSRCPKCGNYEISIPRIEGLHRLIARALIDEGTRFTGAEVRFLVHGARVHAVHHDRREARGDGGAG